MSRTSEYIRERIDPEMLHPVLVPLNGSLPFRTAVKELSLTPDDDYEVIKVRELSDREFINHSLHMLPQSRSQLDLYELWYFPLRPADYERAYTMSKSDTVLARLITQQAKASDLATSAQTGDFTPHAMDTPYAY